MKKILSAIIALACAASLSACNIQEQGEESSEAQSTAQTTTTTPATTTEPSQPEPELALNYLTGEKNLPLDMEGKRPLSFMVNNAIASLPQHGLENADIIYEMPVEGGITRLLAIYANHNSIDRIGSIRSARHNFMDIAAPYNAVYIHMGRSVIAASEIKARGLDNIDGNAKSYAVVQDKSLLYSRGSEHTYFVTKDSLATALSKSGTKLANDNLPAFRFAEAASEDILTGKDCSRLDITFSHYTKAYFDYDAANGVYKKGEYGESQIDGVSGKQLAVTNVMVLFTKVALIPGYDNGLVEISLSSGEGYYASQGKIMPITWEKGKIGDRLRLYNDDGSELAVNTGKSWICFVPTTKKSSFSYR